MTKLEITALFKALDLFLKEGNVIAAQEVLDVVLRPENEKKNSKKSEAAAHDA